jgi:hypothetical protein
MLAAAQLIYTRPSPEYAALFADVTAQLEAVQAVAVGQASHEAEILANLAAINQQAEALILEIQTTLEPILADLAMQQGDLLAQLIGAQEEILLAITGGVQMTTFMAQQAAETVAALADIRTLLAEFLTGQGATADTMAAIAAASLAATAAATAAAAAATASAAAAAAASPTTSSATQTALNDAATAAAAAAQIAAQALANVSAGGFQTGTDFVPRTGTYTLHQGEMVLPPAVADIVRSSPGAPGDSRSAGPVTVNITVNAAPGMDERALAEYVGKVLKRELRFGQAGQIVNERVGR